MLEPGPLSIFRVDGSVVTEASFSEGLVVALNLVNW